MKQIKPLVFTLIAILFLTTTAFAEKVTFVKEYNYNASDLDSKVSSRTIALEQVKRLLLEELGVYLISETEVKNFRLTKDQVTTYSAGIVSAEVVDEKWDGKTYYLKAKVSADPAEVTKSLQNIVNDKQKSKELEDVRKKAAEFSKEIERLKNELEIAKATTKKPEQKADAKKVEQYNEAVKGLSATDWFEKGLNFGESGNYNEEINAYNTVIELAPLAANAYHNRGVAYGDLGNYQQAINDFNKAIQLDPKDAMSYYNRGTVYCKLGNHQQAINDFNKAIQLDPKDAKAYYNRGIAYHRLDNVQKATENYKTAAKLGSKKAQDYLRSEGIEVEQYPSQGQQQVSALCGDIEDCERIGLDYYKTGEYDKAIEIFSKMIGLRPFTISYFVHRGNCYLKKGDNASAISDFKYAASKGDKGAQEFLKSQGIGW